MDARAGNAKAMPLRRRPFRGRLGQAPLPEAPSSRADARLGSFLKRLVADGISRDEDGLTQVSQVLTKSAKRELFLG